MCITSVTSYYAKSHESPPSTQTWGKRHLTDHLTGSICIGRPLLWAHFFFYHLPVHSADLWRWRWRELFTAGFPGQVKLHCVVGIQSVVACKRQRRIRRPHVDTQTCKSSSCLYLFNHTFLFIFNHHRQWMDDMGIMGIPLQSAMLDFPKVYFQRIAPFPYGQSFTSGIC